MKPGTAPFVAARIRMISTLAEAIDACSQEGAAIYPNQAGHSFEELCEAIEALYPLTFTIPRRNRYCIHFDPNDDTLVNSNRYQPLHCDNAHRSTSPDLVLLHFEVVAETGGESTLLRMQRGEVNALGCQISIQYKNGHEVHAARLSDITAKGPDFRYNPFFDEAVFHSYADFVAFAGFVKWVENVAEREIVAVPAGHCLLVNNRSTLHGRMPFTGNRTVNRLWFNNCP